MSVVTPHRMSGHLRPVNASAIRLHPSHQRGRRTPVTKKARRAVLYVGGDPHSRIVLSRVIDRMDGVDLMMAGTGREGRHQVASLSPNLVLLDGQLLEADAQGLIGGLKRAMDRTSTPVAVLSGDESDRVRLVRAGAVSLITKPLRLGEVERSIMTLLDVFWAR